MPPKSICELPGRLIWRETAVAFAWTRLIGAVVNAMPGWYCPGSKYRPTPADSVNGWN
ncbi:hypothetical protein D3C86_1743280 [compost metagenome]